ncbi:2559_t:CDS:2, partial [Funneliformis mosseae]
EEVNEEKEERYTESRKITVKENVSLKKYLMYVINISGVELFDKVLQNLLSQGHAAGFNLDL